jgi:hypothetical protein
LEAHEEPRDEWRRGRGKSVAGEIRVTREKRKKKEITAEDSASGA